MSQGTSSPSLNRKSSPVDTKMTERYGGSPEGRVKAREEIMHFWQYATKLA